MAGAEARIGTATVLFTDLVGSTALRARIGEDQADALREQHDALIHGAITTRQGVVVKHTGDGVMATFSAAVDAVTAAVALQQAIDDHNRRAVDERLDVRVGISVGDVSFSEGDCFGLPVIEAQRLEAAAEGGQILCSDLVSRLARGRGGHDFASVGDLELKGLPDPVPTLEVRWEPVVKVAMPGETPLPSVLSVPRVFDLAGRADESAVLLDAWEEAAAGRRRVVFVSGEPGIGKTRLAVETALAARDHGALVLAGRCDEELMRPFQPFAEALRHQVELRDLLPAAWLGPLAGELARLVPDLPEQMPGVRPPQRGDLETQQALLFDAVTGWLQRTAASVPVLLVLDDLQWADRATVQLLRHVVRETPNAALCVIGTYRSTDVERAHPLASLVADLHREGAALPIALGGLTGNGVAELLARAAGHDLDDAGLGLADALFTETGGNPFFANELVRHLVETGALVMRDGRWTSDLTPEQFGLPDTVRELIDRRVARLDDDTQRLLAVASVIGQQFALPILTRVAGIDHDEALDRLDAARATGLVDEIGLDEYRFGHALVRTARLEEQTSSRRARTHRKIAEAIEELHADDLDPFIADLAYHYGETAASDPDRALHYAIQAGERADATAAAGDALHWYTRALALAPGADVAVRVDLLTRAGRAAWASGTGDAPALLHEAAVLARDAGLYPAMAEALLVKVRQSFYEGQEADPEKIALLEDVVERLDGEPALRARALAVLASELVFVGDRTRRGPLLDEARELALASGDPLAIVDVAARDLDSRPYSGRTAGRLPMIRAHAADALIAAEELHDPYWIDQMHVLAGVYAVMVNDGQAVRTVAAALAESDVLLAQTLNHIVVPQMLAVMEGRLVEAEALCNEMFQVSRAISPQEALTWGAIMQLAVRREQGRLAELAPLWSMFVAERPQVIATVAFALAETGELDQAAIHLHEAARTDFRDVADDLSWPFAMGMWAETAALVKDRDAAGKLHELHTPFDGLLCATGGYNGGPTARLLARLEDVLDRPDEADRHYAEAIEQSRSLSSPVWVARCQLDWAASLLARGEVERARALVDDADATIGPLVLPRLRDQEAHLREQLRAP
jgi:class 3 adenylate cyclase/tetratricopeptide (TPR) repeat protein